MNVTTIAPLKAPGKPVPRGVAQPIVAETRAEVESRELRRWMVGFGVPFTLGAVFYAAAIGTGNQNLIGPAIVLGPILMMICVIFLCLSSDSNGTAR